MLNPNIRTNTPKPENSNYVTLESFENNEQFRCVVTKVIDGPVDVIKMAATILSAKHFGKEITLYHKSYPGNESSEFLWDIFLDALYPKRLKGPVTVGEAIGRVLIVKKNSYIQKKGQNAGKPYHYICDVEADKNQDSSAVSTKAAAPRAAASNHTIPDEIPF